MLSLRYPPPRQITAPGSIWNTPLPADIGYQGGLSTALRDYIAAVNADQGNNGYINTSHGGCKPILASVHDEWEPVELMRPSWDGVVPSWARPRASMLLRRGIPRLPDDYVFDTSNDSLYCAYVPDWEGVDDDGSPLRGLGVELWRLKFRDPSDGGPRLTCQEMGYLHGVETSSGRFRSRYVTSRRGADGLPVDPVEADAYEDPQMGPSISRTLILPGVITVEDVARGEIDHAVRLLLRDYARGKYVWPAGGTDGGSDTSPICCGHRAYLPATYAIPSGLHPVCAMIARAVKKYGTVIADRTHGPTVFQAEPGVEAYFDGVPGYEVLDGFPWHALRVAKVGSDAEPNPLSTW